MTKSAFEDYPRATAVRLVLVLGGAGAVLMTVGWREGITTFWAAGFILVLFAVVSWPDRTKKKDSPVEEPPPEKKARAPRPIPAGGLLKEVATDNIEGLVGQMLAQHRYALLLRPQIAANLREEQFLKAIGALQRKMALVPDGEVTLGPADAAGDGPSSGDREARVAQSRTLRVRRFFLDRYPVTNREYFEFVAAGGYRQMKLWDETAWAAVLECVDETGEPGPRFWREGCFPAGMDNHPVVGVSWYEAAAYARWVGKRLPSDAEWVKAGVWPVPVPGHGAIQHPFPWGDDMDRSRANLWGSGPGEVVAVDRFAEGASPGGVYQLIGNVWEWTASNFVGGDHPLSPLRFAMPMKSIRGGAFDTYLDNQATCQFQSGDGALVRKRNIGFRLAIGVCDLVLDYARRPAGAGAAGSGVTSVGAPGVSLASLGASWDALGPVVNEEASA